MSDRTSPVGILDSGIGGFSVAKQVQHLLPEENLLYFGDGAHIPYGNHSERPLLLWPGICFNLWRSAG